MSFKGFFQPKSFCSMLVCFIILGEIDVSRKRGGIKQMIALKKLLKKTLLISLKYMVVLFPGKYEVTKVTMSLIPQRLDPFANFSSHSMSDFPCYRKCCKGNCSFHFF